jgi:putative tricarboxylic transport membrane protein
LRSLPDIPTAKEVGINYGIDIWAGIFAPAGVPKEVIEKLAAALDMALDDAAVESRLAELGGFLPSKEERKPELFERFVKAEIVRWSPILKAAFASSN